MSNFIIEYSLQANFTHAEFSLKKILLSIEATTSTHHFSYALKSTDNIHQNVFPQNPRGVLEKMQLLGKS
jgi:hypothetical protein